MINDDPGYKEEVTKEMLADMGARVEAEQAKLAFDPAKYTDNPDFNFRNISNEKYRVYVFPPPRVGWPNSEIRVDAPEAVHFKTPANSWQAGGSHRVVTKDGVSVYIPSGWIAMYWEKAHGKFAYEW